MAIQSMTGFGKGEFVGEQYTVSVEVKSVNNRFRDIRFKMSSILNAMELPLKKELEKVFIRGAFDIYVNYKRNPELSKNIELDYEKISNFIKQIQIAATKVGSSVAVNPTDFLRGDFYLEDETKQEVLQSNLVEAFNMALKDIEASRAEEGKKLVVVLQEHIEQYKLHFKQIEKLRTGYQAAVKEKLLKKFQAEGAGLEVDEPRFLQEVIYYLEKLDIDEEINRIKSHLSKLESILKSSGEIGRQIDFLVQELNRETNTIGSKAGHDEISEAVVQMKVQLEKVREQGLNLE